MTGRFGLGDDVPEMMDDTTALALKDDVPEMMALLG